MITPEPDAAALSGVEADVMDAFESMSAVMAGLPDASVLARMANEMWKGLPGAADAAEEASAASGASAAPAPDPLDEAELRALAGLVAAPSGSDVSSAMPAPFDPASLSGAPSFYFLQDASLPEATRELPSSRLPSSRAEWTEIRPEILPAAAPGGVFDAASIRRDFPILSERVHGKPLIWLDNAATTQKPRAVIERITRFYEHENSNVHRAAHAMAARSSDAYEAARETARRFLGAGSTREIVFVRGATEGLNLLSQSWGRRHVGEGDEIILTRLEHHSNIVPWQLLCAEKGARLRIAPIDDSGQIMLDAYERLFNAHTKLVSFTHVSNALGTVTPVREMIEIAHRHGARVIVDGAQAVSHLAVDVQALGCDFYVFSGHKVFGPTGIGVVYGKEDVLDAMPPWQGGGNMIADVTFEKTVYQPAPMRFEAGTGNIADAVGLGAALEYLMGVGLERVTRHEHDLLVYATEAMLDVPGLRLVGTARDKAGVLSFVLDGQRSEDVGKALDEEGIAVRSGHHCAQPALRRFGLEGSVRPSLALYNTCADIDALVAALRKLQRGH